MYPIVYKSIHTIVVLKVLLQYLFLYRFITSRIVFQTLFFCCFYTPKNLSKIFIFTKSLQLTKVVFRVIMGVSIKKRS